MHLKIIATMRKLMTKYIKNDEKTQTHLKKIKVGNLVLPPSKSSQWIEVAFSSVILIGCLDFGFLLLFWIGEAMQYISCNHTVF